MTPWTAKQYRTRGEHERAVDRGSIRPFAGNKKGNQRADHADVGGERCFHAGQSCSECRRHEYTAQQQGRFSLEQPVIQRGMPPGAGEGSVTCSGNRRSTVPRPAERNHR